MAIAPAREGRGGFASHTHQNRLPWKSIREASWKTNEAHDCKYRGLYFNMKNCHYFKIANRLMRLRGYAACRCRNKWLSQDQDRTQPSM